MSSASSTSTSPKPSRSLNRQQVLEEDEYTVALSEIVARDFFPSLVHLDATNTYLDALQSEDTQRINASVRRLHDLSTPQPSSSRGYPLQTPGRTPYGAGPSDTPTRTPRAESVSHKRPRFDSSLSLDLFQARYTSEDNASFTEILDEENRKRKEKWGWAWEAQKRARDVKVIEMNRRDNLLIEDTTSQPPGVKQRIMVEKPDVKMITAGEEDTMALDEVDVGHGSTDGSVVVSKANGKATTALVKVEAKDNNAEVDVMAPKKDTRSAAVDGWSFKTRNSLMFGPGADISPYDGPTSLPTEHAKGPPKLIKHANTRLPEQSNEDGDTASTAPSSPTRSKVGAAIAGTPYVPRDGRADLPLLPSLPSPTPSQLGPAAVNQLMTWGTLTSTPRILSSDPNAVPGSTIQTPATPFHLPAPTPREKVAHKLSSTASRSLRAKASLLSGTPARPALGIPLGKSKRNARDMTAPSTPRAHPGLLTPAARRLLDRTAGVRTSAARRAEAMSQESNWEGFKGKGKELGNVRWTPSPSPMARRMT